MVIMDKFFEELGIPKAYLKDVNKKDRFVALVHQSWLKYLFKHGKLVDFVEKEKLETWHELDEDFGKDWIKVFITVFKKKELKVMPLPRACFNDKNEPSLLFPQMMQYVSTANFKNLWKQCYKTYSCGSESVKNASITLSDYNHVLREIIVRTYGCSVIDTCDPNGSALSSKRFECHLNILPAICAVETLSAMFLIQMPFIPHTLHDCLTFSPDILQNCYTKPLYIIYQLLQCLKSLHDRSLTLGEITLSDIYLNDDLWIQIFPQILSNIHVQPAAKNDLKKSFQNSPDCRKFGHTFDANQKCACGLKTYDKIRLTGKESLERLTRLWIDSQISNFTYLTALNKLSGRKYGDPHCHHVFPWVTDFSSRCGRNWRDLKKSKFRLNKGDPQLDLTYTNSLSQVPHHVSDVLSSITYYVYMARRTPKLILCKYVRTNWVPAEYPSSIQRLQSWTPDECIPEFFTDPLVFKSIHDDLDDLEVPHWSTSPEDFIQQHREILESSHVSERLHHWIDLTFGYKLSGNAAIKAKNVCLPLVDGHTHLTKSGIVQLFTHPHPPKATKSIFWSKSPPKIHIDRHKHRTREHSASSSFSIELSKSEEEEYLYEDDGNLAQQTRNSPLALSRFLSRSRSSLSEEPKEQKVTRSSSAQRSTNVGPKNPTFTSHVAKPSTNRLSIQKPSLSTGTIYLPKEYNPAHALTNFENFYSFLSKTFYSVQDFSSKPEDLSQSIRAAEIAQDDDLIPNAFTNRIFTENFEAKFNKSFTFPSDNHSALQCSPKRKISSTTRSESQISCNYSEIVMARRIKELQILGCLIVEIFMPKQLRALDSNNLNLSFSERLKACMTVAQRCKSEIPLCVKYIIQLLLPEGCHLENFKYPTVTNFGLPPPRAHLFLEPLLHCVLPFPKSFIRLYTIVSSLKDFDNATQELHILYHFDCNGEMCKEYESLERTKILFTQNISECKVKRCSYNLESFMENINTVSEFEVIKLLLPYVKYLLEEPSTSVLAAWYLFDPIASVLGPQKTSEALLRSLLKLYDSESTVPYNSKVAKLYHHSFLLGLMVRLGLKCFLENFVTALVEAVGGYKDYDKIDFVLHTHCKTIIRKPSNLRSIDSEQIELSPSDDSSSSSDKQTLKSQSDPKTLSDPEIFVFEQDVSKNEEEQTLKSLIEHLELNVTTDLPFNHSTAEEALDASLTESIEQLRSLEELKLNLSDDYQESNLRNVTSPTIPIPPSYKQVELNNISCEIGSKNSDNDCTSDKNSNTSQFEVKCNSLNSTNNDQLNSGAVITNQSKFSAKSQRNEATISEMSSDSLIWLSHRLGPVLTAKYLARNLLRMLTLCYVGKENLAAFPPDGRTSPGSGINLDLVTIASSRVVGDQNAAKVLDCLASIAALYGEQLILVQYFPHMSELIAMCKKRRLTPNLEGGLISSLALLQHIVPYLCDATFMDYLQDIILKNILHPVIKLLGTTRYIFPNGRLARNVLARKYLDAIYLLSLRMGSDWTRTHLVVPSLQRFFLIFDKAHGSCYQSEGLKSNTYDHSSPAKSMEDGTHYIEVRRDGTTKEWAVGGRPLQISHVGVTESLDSLSPPAKVLASSDEEITIQALEEIRAVFTSELAHTSYLPFFKQIGLNSMEASLKNHALIRNLCQEYEQEVQLTYPSLIRKNQLSDCQDDLESKRAHSSSIGSNVAVIGNRIDVQVTNENSDPQTADVLNLISNKMENTARHLRGNWLAYWEHEIGRSSTTFNFKQIRLQNFSGHLNSVKTLSALDNENSFMSGSRDKTVKLWSLRSHGDGSSVSSCQWTYTAHRKSVLSLTFLESMRLVASSDSVVHIWDPFLGANVGHLESPKFPPINVLKCMPAPSCLFFAATTEGIVRVIDARLCNYVYDLKVSGVNPNGIIRCLVVSQSGNWIAAGQSSGHITVLDTRTGLVISTWRAHENEVLQLVAHGEHTLISSSLDQLTIAWNIQDGKPRFYMKGTTEPVHCLNIYGNELISGTTANRIGVHTSVSDDASFSSTKLRSDAFKGLLTSMAILPLNRLLLLGADNGNITLLC